MKKFIVYFLLLILALSAVSCTLFINQHTPKGYVRYAVYLLDRDGLYADGAEWAQKRKEVLKAAKSITDLDEAHRLVQEAADVAGGKHSFLWEPVKDTASYPEFAPEVKMLEGGIIHAVLPGHTGVKVSDSLYIHMVFDYLQDHPDARGVIVDLRNNTGGNMYPMIASISPLLPEGIVLQFKSRKQTTPVSLDYVTRSYEIAADDIRKFPASTPVAVLTDEKTGSSGEATLICFLGLDNVKTFGHPTAGYPSGNVTHTLSDGYLFAITRSAELSRTGELFCEDPINPDVNTETPLEDAIAWIESHNIGILLEAQ